MRQFRNMPVFKPEPFANNRRRNGRIRTQNVATSLGPVIDVSASGMRVRCGSSPKLEEGQETEVTLSTPEGPLTVPVRVMWIRRKMLGGREVGIHFVDMTPTLRAVLVDMGRTSVQHMFVSEDERTLRKSA